jgi:polyhydroxyalkanoate synthesis regulator phasin
MTGIVSGQMENEKQCKFLQDILSNIQQIDKNIDIFITKSLTDILDAMQSFENTLDAEAVKQNIFLKNVLSDLNKESKKLINNEIWPPSDVHVVSQIVSESLPNAVKVVSKALVKPLLRLPRDAVNIHLESYKK